MTGMFEWVKNKAFCIIILINTIAAHLVITTEVVGLTTENYKDELFKAFSSIYRIMKNYDTKYQLSQNTPLEMQSFLERKLASSPTRRLNHYVRNTKNIGEHVSFHSNHKTKLNKPQLLRGKKTKHKRRFKAHLASSKGTDSVYIKKLRLQKAIMKISRENTDGKLKHIQKTRLRSGLKRVKPLTMLSHYKDISPYNTTRMDTHSYSLKYDMSNIDNFSKDLISESNYKKESNGNKNSANEPIRMTHTSETKRLIGSTTRSSKVEEGSSNARIYNTKLPDVPGVTEKLDAIRQLKTNSTVLKDDLIVVNNILLKNATNQHSVDEYLTNNSHLRNYNKKINSSLFPIYDNSSGNNSVTVMNPEGVLNARKGSKKPIIDIPFIDGNSTSKNKADPSSLFSNNNLGQGKPFIKRKERIAEDMLANKSNISSPVYQGAMNAVDELFNYSSSRTILLVAFLSVTLLVAITIIIITLLRRFKCPQSKDEIEPLLSKSSTPLFDDKYPELKKGIKRNRNKSRSNSSSGKKNYTMEENSRYFSIASDSGSIDEDELIYRKDHNSANKHSILSDSFLCSLKQQSNPDLQYKRNVLKTSENPRLKLLKLHQNLSTRTGNVCYSDVLRRSKENPKFEDTKLLKKSLPQDDSFNFLKQFLYPETDDNNDYCNSDTDELKSKNVSFEKVENDDKNSVFLIKSEKGLRIKEDDEDTTNPFNESFEVDEKDT